MDSKYSISFTVLQRSLAILALLCFAFFAQAQEEELPALGVMKFKSSGATEVETKKISRLVEAALFKTGRFKIVTRQLLDVLDLEREKQKANIDDIVLEQGIAIGAKYIVKGTVTNFSKDTKQGTTRTNNNQYVKDKIYSKTTVRFSIKIVEVETGVIHDSDVYTGSINGIDYFIRRYIRKVFPEEIKIVEALKLNDDKKTKHVLVDVGSRHGFVPNLHVEVFLINRETIDGFVLEKKKKVGDLYVKKLDTSGNFAMCKIHKGRKEILKLLGEGVDLICRVPTSHKFLGLKFDYSY